MRYLAIDHGLKRIGLATCDSDETICSPLHVIDNPATAIGEIVDVIKSYMIEAVVIGLPLNMDGTEGDQAKRARDFAKELQRECVDLPFYFHDERLSSFEAKEKLSGSDLTRKKKKKKIDAIAAAEILRGFLESRDEGV